MVTRNELLLRVEREIERVWDVQTELPNQAQRANGILKDLYLAQEYLLDAPSRLPDKNSASILETVEMSREVVSVIRGGTDAVHS